MHDDLMDKPTGSEATHEDWKRWVRLEHPGSSGLEMMPGTFPAAVQREVIRYIEGVAAAHPNLNVDELIVRAHADLALYEDVAATFQ